jgi:hypothetical protein
LLSHPDGLILNFFTVLAPLDGLAKPSMAIFKQLFNKLLKTLWHIGGDFVENFDCDAFNRLYL